MNPTLLFASFLVATVQADPVSSTCYRNGPQVDSKALLSHNDVVYLSPAVHEHEAMPVGNGRLCAVVWNQNGLDLEITSADSVWFQNSSGRVRIATRPSLLDNVASFQQRQSLYDGTVQTRCKSGVGEWRSTVLSIPGTDVIAVRFEGKLAKDTEIVATLEEWRKTAKPSVDGKTAGFMEDLIVPEPSSRFSRKSALLARADCPVRVKTPVIADDQSTIEMRLTPAAKRDGTVAFTLYLANPFVSTDADPLKMANQQLDEALKKGWREALTRSETKWKQFWERSFVYLTSPDNTADYMANLWYLHLNWMGCMGEGEFAAKFDGGAFLMHRDSRSWGSSYWYQNTREMYWPLTYANHLELCRGFQHLYLSTMDAHRKLAASLYKKRGIAVEETMQINGAGDKAITTSTMLYLSTGLECALQLYDECVFARDEQTLRDKVYPMMKEAVEFYIDYAKKGEDGLYHIAPVTARETYQFVQDGLTDIAALRVAIPILVRESKRLGVDADLGPKWNEFLAKLAPLPVTPAGDAYAPCVIPAKRPVSDVPFIEEQYAKQEISTNFAKRFNGENVEMDVVHPFGLVGIDSGKKEWDMAVNAYQRRPFAYGGGWDSAPIWAARLGLADEFVKAIRAHAVTQVSPQGFWYSPSIDIFAGGVPDCPYFDSAGVNATATSEALLQSYNDRIRVWASTPPTWNGVFRLRAQTGFLVASERADGVVQYVEVESLFGDSCRIVNPWKGESVKVTAKGRTALQSADDLLQFPTKQGQRYLVECASQPVAKMKFAKPAPASNRDVKILNMTGDLKTMPKPGRNQPMLGITADGMTSPRAIAIALRQQGEQRLAPFVANKARKTGFTATWINSSMGKTEPAPWLGDGVFGERNIGRRENIGAYVLEFAQPTSISVVIHSYDRTGGRQDARPNMWSPWPGKLVVETSADGKVWKLAGEYDTKGDFTRIRDLIFGVAIPLNQPVEARFIRVSAVNPQGQSIPEMPCDEIEVY